MITQTTENNDMQLQDGQYLVIGYNSPQLGLLSWLPAEWHRPVSVCVNDIVDTETGAAVVVSVHNGIELRPLWVSQEAAAKVEMRELAELCEVES